MPQKHSNELPSIEDIVGQTVLLPSVEEYLQEESVEEDIQVIDDLDGNPSIEISDVVKAPEWGELLRLINNVRENIPEIPEIKTYDKELEAICEIIDDIKASIPVVPEVRYYEEELEIIKESIQLVKQSIPSLPSWIDKVTEVPDFTWVGQTFNTVDERFKIVEDCVETISSRIQDELNRIEEEKEVFAFESKTDFKNIHDRVGTLKEQIFNQLKEQSEIIWKLQKKLKDNQKEFEIVITDQVNNKIDDVSDVTAETVKRIEESLNKKFEYVGNKIDVEVDSLKNKLNSLPKLKYYEEDINKIKEDLKNFESLREIVEQIQIKQERIEDLQENYLLTEPPDEPENIGTGQDPLTPMDQKFATLKDLAEHYRIFINRVQTQLSTMGGGGAGFIKDLDDVEFDGATGNNKLLIYDQTNSKWVGIASTALSGSSTLISLTDVNSSNLGDGRFLRYDASSSEFTFAPVSATNLELIAGDIQSGVLTTNSTGPAVVMSISASTYRSVNYQIQVTEGTNYNSTTISVIHDGTTTYMSEYGTINQPVGVATFSTDINGGSLRLIGYPASGAQTTFKTVFTAIEV